MRELQGVTEGAERKMDNSNDADRVPGHTLREGDDSGARNNGGRRNDLIMYDGCPMHTCEATGQTSIHQDAATDT